MKVYTREEVLKSCLDYFKGDELAANVWINKYALKDSDGNIYELNPDDMHRRIAREIARIEQQYVNPLSEDEIYDLIKNFKYIIPQGGSMSGIGNDMQFVSLSNCFVIGNEADSYGGIMKTDEEQTQLMKRRGGVGHDLSHIRPKGTPVKNSALTSTGIVPFMERFSNSTREVAQDGRRGALMLTISIKHPDSIDFIDAKLTPDKITGANVSIKIDDEFMNAVQLGKTYRQQYPIDSDNPKLIKDIDAKAVFDKIVHNAWKSAEPGILFWDTIIRESVPDCYSDLGYKTISTNPCLTSDSLIMTDNGEITIKEIVDNFNTFEYNVLTYNEKTKQLEYNKVSDAFLSKRNANIIQLELEDGILLKLTPDHRVYTENRGWIEASQLNKDDILIKVEQTNIVKTKIKKISISQNEDVYDLKVDNNHNFFANKILVHNCGEIPLCPYDSCRLIAINLYSYVVNPFTDKAEFDYELFKKHAIYAQRIMDDIVDLEIEKIDAIINKIKLDPEDLVFKKTELELWEKIKFKTKQARRIGIGVTGEGDMLAAMGLTYGTPEATAFSENIHKILAINVYKASAILAKERGVFDIYDVKRELNNPFIKRLFEADKELKELMNSYGRRNIALLTIAPTGTTSLMCQTTSGIEPVFKVVYMRRRKVNPNDKNVKAVFVDNVGDYWEEYPIFHSKFLEWAKIKGYDIEKIKTMKSEELAELVKQSPYHKATTEDVDWIEKVKMQGAIQKWIDHSISVTVNLPADATEEIVSKVFMNAWKSGCKGVTIYRDGSRSGVLISKDEKKEQDSVETLSERSAPKRPKILECDVVAFNNNHEKWIGFIGLLNGRPYEIFTGKADSLLIPSWVEKGHIRKVKDNGNGSRYDFIYIDRDGYEQEVRGLNRVFDKEYWNIAKTFSGLLRHGMPIINLYELICSLKFDGDEFSTWKAGLKRMIKKYIKDGSIVKNEKCLNCHSNNLVYQDGCLHCKNCGWSKCG